MAITLKVSTYLGATASPWLAARSHASSEARLRRARNRENLPHPALLHRLCTCNCLLSFSAPLVATLRPAVALAQLPVSLLKDQVRPLAVVEVEPDSPHCLSTLCSQSQTALSGQVWPDWLTNAGVVALAAAAACWVERPRGWADSSLLEVCSLHSLLPHVL